MKSLFPFDFVMMFGFLSIMLLVGVALRAKIPAIQKFLFPACLIGGVLGMILINAGMTGIEPSSLENFAYHLLNMSFISVGLTKDETMSGTRLKSSDMFKGPFWIALVQGITFPLQAIVGGIFVLLFGFFGVKLFPTFGFLIPLGYNEGPGQALAFGKVWEKSGFMHGATIGLTFAVLGFFFAFFVGIPLANWGIRKGLSTFASKELPPDFLRGIKARNEKRESAGEQTIHSANIDTLAFQTAIVGLVYLLTYFLVIEFGKLFAEDVARMLWGVVFIFGLVIALLVRKVMQMLGVDYLIDPGVQRRITGWNVDFLILATIAAIQLTVVWEYILPITLSALTAGVLTTIVIFYLGSRADKFNIERTVSVYGCLTGTLPCGLLLLRIVDPDYKTPVAIELGLMNIFAIPIISGCMILTNSVLWWKWCTLPISLLLFAGVALVCFVLINIIKMYGPRKF